MQTNDYAYFGVECDMKPGSVAVSQDGTYQHVIAIHTGYNGYWAEVGVCNFNWVNYEQYYTYDWRNGGWVNYETVPNQEAYSNFVIVENPYDYVQGEGYQYNIYINSMWVRMGYLPSFYNDADHSNEVWTQNAGQYTTDTSPAIFYPNYLDMGNSWYNWDNTFPTNFWWAPNPCPVWAENYLSGGCYFYETLVMPP
jgi:hypothetical protein